MNKTIFTIAIFIIAGIISYTFLQKNDDLEPEQVSTEVVETIAPAAAEKHAEFESFWTDFQKFVTEKNTVELTKMLGEVDIDSPDKFSESYIPLEDDFFELLNNTKASDVKTTIDSSFPAGSKIFSWEESFTDEEGTTFESGTYFYFSKLDGIWKIVFINLAG